jgi:predicted O-methyltransferase YrrM
MNGHLIAKSVTDYLNALVPVRSPEISDMEQYARDHSFPIIGPAVGNLCYLIARMMGASRVFEMGSGYGYSTAWFARAVQENGGGVVHHVVWDNDLSLRARKHLTSLGYSGIMEYTVGEAVQALRNETGPFDLIFNDIDKHAYPESLDVIEQKLRPGGVLIVDNMFLRGRIFDESNHSESVEGVRTMTTRIAKNPDWISSIIPIRDGFLVAFKKN